MQMLVKIAMNKVCYLKYISEDEIEELENKKVVLRGYDSSVGEKYFWEVKRVGEDVVFVRKKGNVNGESERFSVFEIKAVIDAESVLTVKTKAVVNVNNEEMECEAVLVKDDVTDSYIVSVTVPGIVENEHIQLPDEVGMIFDSIENPVELVSLIEGVLVSEGFWKYILDRLEV